MREAVIANVRMQVHQLKQNSVIIEAIQKKEIAVIGAYYEISSGAVDFLETDQELSIDDQQVLG
jgi:carbonic anhydrase